MDNERLTSVNTVDFPLPQNLKIELNMNDPKADRAFLTKEAMSEKVRGKRVWIEISCVKEECVLIDAEGTLKELLEHGAVAGSSVILSDIPVEYVKRHEYSHRPVPVIIRALPGRSLFFQRCAPVKRLYCDISSNTAQ